MFWLVTLEAQMGMESLAIALDMTIFTGKGQADKGQGGRVRMGFDKMKFLRLFSDDDGESHWEDVEVTLDERSFAPPAQNIEVSDPEPVKQTMFLRLRSGWNEPIHPTPVAQKLICLSGTVRVTASDGDFRDIGPGDVWHMEDRHGKGHHTKVISKENFESVIIQYE